jgi:hypothetical protein
MKHCLPLIFALSAIGTAHAGELPEAFLGEWASENVGDHGITITQRQYHEPGYHCDIRSVQQKSEAATRCPVYLVVMSCSDEGPRPFLVREIWAMRKIGNDNFLAIAGVSGPTFPSINVLHRPK